MRKHASQEHDTFFDIKGEIRSIVGAITEAQVERDSELVSELTDELIALIDKHEDKYELYAQVIKNSINGEQKRRQIAYLELGERPMQKRSHSKISQNC